MSALQLSTLSTVDNKPAAARNVKETASDDLQTAEEKPFNQQLNEEIEKTGAASTAEEPENIKEPNPEKELVSETNDTVKPEPEAAVEEENTLLLTGNLLPPSSQQQEQPEPEVQAQVAVVNPDAVELIEEADKNTRQSANRVMKMPATQGQIVSGDLKGIGSEEITVDLSPEKTDVNNKESIKLATDNIAVKSESTDFSRLVKQATTTQQVPVGLNMATENGARETANQITQQLQVATPVQNKQWGSEFAQRISMMITNGQQQTAELQLNPARLGPLSVKLHIEDDRANITFVTHQHAVKEAIEISLPRLKDQLEQQGLDLGQVDVSTQENDQGGEAESSSGQMSSFENQDVETSVNNETVIHVDLDEGVSIFV